jgi:general stress protein 26
MDSALRMQILEMLQAQHVLDLATIRDDGWPQTTTVGYVNTGFTLFVATGAHAQKVLNIRANQRVSLAIHNGGADWGQLQGLSMAATAEVMSSRADMQHVARMLKKKFPSLEPISDPERDRGWAFLRIVPHVISVIDYTKGFGHTVLAKV